MKGSAHAVLGAAIGFGVAQKVSASPEDVLFLTGAGVISGLIPDLDTGGKLANRISVSNKYLNSAVRLIGILLGCYAYFFAAGMDKYISFASAFILLFVLPQFSKKFMLLLTGVIITVAGYVLATVWIQLLGIYVIIASLLSHRSYTHSLLGLIFYGVIVHYFEADFPIEGMYAACMLGYISHLITDMRFIPGNRRGIKLFLPYKGMEL